MGAAEALLERGAVVVHPSREEAVAAMAAEAAREAGREGALAVTVATNADAAELNQAARALRVAAGEVDDSAVATGMDGARIGAGDRVVTRRNDNTLAVANRQSWTVSAVNDDGSLMVRGKERHVQLPAEYVTAAVQLGYAATDYGNQGVTAARSATWVGPATSAGGLYVGASRGRWENTLHVVADGPEEARDVLAAAVRRDRADRGLDAARARAEAEAVRPAPAPGPRVVPEGWRSAAELEAALRRVESRLARELARAAPVPVMDEAVWRAETAADRAIAEQGPLTAAWYEGEAARAGRGGEKPSSRPGPSSSGPGRTPGWWRPAPGASGAGPSGCGRQSRGGPGRLSAGGATSPSCPGSAGPDQRWPRRRPGPSTPAWPTSYASTKPRRQGGPRRPMQAEDRIASAQTPGGRQAGPTTKRPGIGAPSWPSGPSRPGPSWSGSASALLRASSLRT